MARISIDCDGVLASFTEGFSRAARACGIMIPPDWEPTSWGYEEMVTKEEFNRVWKHIRTMDNFWLTLMSYPNNVGDMAQFLHMENGHEVFVTTARVATAGLPVARQTELWLQSCGLRSGPYNYLGVIVCEGETKVDVYRATDVQFSVDDKPETVEACDRLPNHKAFLLDRPWNQDANVERRITRLSEFFKAIKGETQRD